MRADGRLPAFADPARIGPTFGKAGLMTDGELLAVLGRLWRTERQTDEWLEWAKQVVEYLPLTKHGSLAVDEAASYLCRLLYLLADFDKPFEFGTSVDLESLRLAFHSGLAISHRGKDRPADYLYHTGLDRCRVSGLMRLDEVGRWHPGMQSGSGYVDIVFLTIPGRARAFPPSADDGTETSGPTDCRRDAGLAGGPVDDLAASPEDSPSAVRASAAGKPKDTPDEAMPTAPSTAGELREEFAFSHAPCFTGVTWGAKRFEFREAQAACVCVMWQALDFGEAFRTQAYILENAYEIYKKKTGIDSEEAKALAGRPRLRDVFKIDKSHVHEAWGAMIVREGKDRYGLKRPDTERQIPT